MFLSPLLLGTLLNVAQGLISISNNSQLNQILLNLTQYYNPNSVGSNIGYALTSSDYQFVIYGGYRKQAIILFDATYPLGDLLGQPDYLKNRGVSIITIVDGDPDPILANNLTSIASPGMNFSFLDPNLTEQIQSSLLITNCFCPPSYYQMKVFNTTLNTTATYADCFHSYSNNTSPDVAKQTCDPDVLVPVTSSTKLDFIVDHVIPAQMVGAKNFTTGAIRSNGNWNWQNYNNTQFPFGEFPNAVNATGGDIGYFSNTFGFNWEFRSGGSGDDYARPFICQTHAYDADNMRDLGDS
ncbi:hypothetical protein FO519_006942 [Halicephalobus sp. NKZ332]|nr:hypothetical protein FO519_006942 [Halicephalobus sp. NKZ332]